MEYGDAGIDLTRTSGPDYWPTEAYCAAYYGVSIYEWQALPSADRLDLTILLSRV
jgi:hypothetical protein